MRVEKDFKEFFELLNENKVKYLVVGGFDTEQTRSGQTPGYCRCKKIEKNLKNERGIIYLAIGGSMNNE